MQYIRIILTSLVIILLVSVAVRNEQDLKTLGAVALVTGTISGVFALLQHYSIGPTASIFLLGTPRRIGERAMGLNDSPVDLSFTLSLIILPAVSLLFFGQINRRYRALVILSVLVMTLALYYSYTRSGIYALGAGAVVFVFSIGSKVRKEIFLLVLILCAAFLIYVDAKGNRYAGGFSDESSAAGRLLLWQVSAKIAVNYPVLGIGRRAFREMSQAYIPEVSYDPTVVDASEVLGVEQPHNDTLRVWVSFGTPALITYVWLFLAIFRNLIESSRRTSRRYIKGMAIGCSSALVAYIVNTGTHNMLDSVSFMWIIAGLSAVTYRLATPAKRKAVKAVLS